jgi:1,4-dihydroxy-2-naphthoyl-CoA hydrolase
LTVPETSVDGPDPFADVTPEQVTEWLEPFFHGVLGMKFTEVGFDCVRSQLKVTPVLEQGLGTVHGGVYCSMIESTASLAGSAWLRGRGHAVGLSNATDFFRPVSAGTLYATASPVHRGRSQQLWKVEVTDDEDRLVACGQVRLHNVYAS